MKHEPHEMTGVIIKKGEGEYEAWARHADDADEYGLTWVSLGDFKTFDAATAAILAGIVITTIECRGLEV